MATGNCKICGKPAEGRTGRSMFCAGDCYRQHERNYSRQHAAKFSPERKRASNIVATAITSGRLKRQPCEVCGAKLYAQAHHDDYAKPLDVRWLCRGCHKRHHVKFGPGLNAYASPSPSKGRTIWISG